MVNKTALVVAFALLVGCLAVPTPDTLATPDPSFWQQHVDPSARIVGGTEAPAGSHPHMVALTNGLLVRSFFCGGSLVSQRSVLTAAHCIDAVFSWGSLSTNLRVTVGTNRWNQGGQSYSVLRNVTHQHYVSATIKNDIGLLITSTNVDLTALAQPIPLAFDEVPGGVPSRAAGWGRIIANGALSAALLEINVNTLSGQECIDRVLQAELDLNMRAPPVEPHIEICTFHGPGLGTCNGDSGSALVRISDGRQIGIVSWGFPCARGAPDMFVRVSGFTDWLLLNVL